MATLVRKMNWRVALELNLLRVSTPGGGEVAAKEVATAPQRAPTSSKVCNADIWCMLGFIAWQQGLRNEAIANFEKSVSLDPLQNRRDGVFEPHDRRRVAGAIV